MKWRVNDDLTNISFYRFSDGDYHRQHDCGGTVGYVEKIGGRVMIWCYCESCKNHDDDDTCKLDSITVSDREMTAAGFLPQCQEYEEAEGEE